MVSLILTCAGKGVRAGFEKNKLLQNLDGETVIERTFNACKDTGFFDEIIITVSEDDYGFFVEKFKGKALIVKGGKTRHLSVKNGLEKVNGDMVLIHDGARPFVAKKAFERCIESVKKHRSGICAIPQTDTVSKANSDGQLIQTLGKENLYSIQTPQGYYTQDLRLAMAKATRDDYPDESSLYSEFIAPAHLCEGDINNKKLTYREDFSTKNLAFRTGVGFDCHKLVPDRALILGGINIKHDKGLLGHSDADVLTHAICDAILSALALRDIGYHFPDSDTKYKGANSIDLLREVLKMANDKNYQVYSVSACIMAEKPKLLGYIPQITKNLASVLGISEDMLGIGATTLEGLGFVGREEGICVNATATLKPI